MYPSVLKSARTPDPRPAGCMEARTREKRVIRTHDCLPGLGVSLSQVILSDLPQGRNTQTMHDTSFQILVNMNCTHRVFSFHSCFWGEGEGEFYLLERFCIILDWCSHTLWFCFL